MKTNVFLFGLASSDAYRAGDVTIAAVGSYPAVSPLPDPRRLELGSRRVGHRRSLLCGAGVGSLRLGVTQRSALEVRTFLSSPEVTSGHPTFSLARSQYRKGSHGMQGMKDSSDSSDSSNSAANGWQFSRWNRRFGSIDRHGFRHPLFQLVNPCLVARMSRHEFGRRATSRLFHALPQRD